MFCSCGCQTAFILAQEVLSFAKAFLPTPGTTGGFLLPSRRQQNALRTGCPCRGRKNLSRYHLCCPHPHGPRPQRLRSSEVRRPTTPSRGNVRTRLSYCRRPAGSVRSSRMYFAPPARRFTPASGSLIHPSLLTFLAPRFLGLKFVIILRLDAPFVNPFFKKFSFCFFANRKAHFYFSFFS